VRTVTTDNNLAKKKGFLPVFIQFAGHGAKSITQKISSLLMLRFSLCQKQSDGLST
jgi:hypothetical protein